MTWERETKLQGTKEAPRGSIMIIIILDSSRVRDEAEFGDAWRMLLRQRRAQRQQLKPPRNSDDDTSAAHPVIP